MNINSNTTFHQKLNLINQKRHIFDSSQLKSLNSLQQFESVKQPWREPSPYQYLNFSKCVKLETFYKCCMPAYYSLSWQEQINYKTARPLSGIVAFKELGQQFYSIDQKFVTWVESGGTRITPIKSNTTQGNLTTCLKNIHSLIIPEFKGQIQIMFFQILAKIIQQFKDLPILAFGNSAILLMSQLNNYQQLRKRIKFDIKFHNADVYAFTSHIDSFFLDLNVKTRLQIQNKTKVLSTSAHLPVEVLLNMKNQENIQILALSKGKGDQWGLLMARQQLIHYCFFQPVLNANNMEATTFYHKIIVNFMQQVRKRQKIVQQKQLQVGQFKMAIKDDRYLYNCDVKVPKI